MDRVCTVVQPKSSLILHHRARPLPYSAVMVDRSQIFKSKLQGILAGNIRACIDNTPKMNIKTLAEKSGVPERTIHSWLSTAASARAPQISDDLQRVARVFGLDAWALFFPLLTVLSGEEQKATIEHPRKYVHAATETRRYVDHVISKEVS